jgi:hypothetical protein
MTALDEGTGTTLLHEAVRRSDLRLLEVAIAGGADVFVRDRKGKSIYDLEKGHSKEQERVKAYLRQCKAGHSQQDRNLIISRSTRHKPRCYPNKYILPGTTEFERLSGWYEALPKDDGLLTSKRCLDQIHQRRKRLQCEVVCVG